MSVCEVVSVVDIHSGIVLRVVVKDVLNNSCTPVKSDLSLLRCQELHCLLRSVATSTSHQRLTTDSSQRHLAHIVS